MAEQELTAPQRALVETWERHMAAEFDTKSIEATMATMTADPVVNHVPVMTGGVGARDVRHFYAHYFIHDTLRTLRSFRSPAPSVRTGSWMS